MKGSARDGFLVMRSWVAALAIVPLSLLGCDAGDRSRPEGGGGAGGDGSSSGPAGGMSANTTGTGTGAGGAPPFPSGGYYVQGNTVYDDDGNPHVFRGIARPSHEWNPSGEMISLQDFQFIAGWGANVTRLSLNQGFWLEGSSVYNANYKQNIDQAIQWAQQAGLDVILDLHWSDKGNPGMTPAQQRMADTRSITFWSQVADRYKDNGRVLFELYNEPHDVSWSVWQSGGDSGDGFTAAGMQQLYDAVRAAGADNLVLIGGLDFAFDLSQVPNHRIQGYNIIYVTHPYDFNNKQPGTWEGKFGFLVPTDPIMVTEFGSFDCSTGYTQQLIDYADQRGIHWTGWAWYPGGCDFPALIQDWNGNPNAPGQVVRAALQSN